MIGHIGVRGECQLVTLATGVKRLVTGMSEGGDSVKKIDSRIRSGNCSLIGRSGVGGGACAAIGYRGVHGRKRGLMLYGDVEGRNRTLIGHRCITSRLRPLIGYGGICIFTFGETVGRSE